MKPMIHVVEAVNSKLSNLSKATGLTTGKVRNISAELFSGLEDKSIEHVLLLCEQLLKERKWALGIIAYDWAYRVNKQYNEQTFHVFESWLKEYVTDWGDCDDFCTHALGSLISQNNGLFEYVLGWTKHPDFWVRRGAAVSLIYPIKKSKYQEINPFLISDALMKDEHYLVLKGYGWMLKVLSQQEPDIVFEYLLKNQSCMPRISYRYALEKLPKEMKTRLMEV